MSFTRGVPLLGGFHGAPLDTDGLWENPRPVEAHVQHSACSNRPADWEIAISIRRVDRVLRLRMWSAMTMVLGLAGCAGATTAASVPPGYSAGATGDAVVVGRIEMVRADGTALMPLPAVLIGRMTLLVQSERTAAEYEIRCDVAGVLSDFYVALPPGRYRLVEWKGGHFQARVSGGFDVPSRPAVYVGTLRFTGEAWPFWQRGSWSTVDAFDGTVGAFRARYPDMGADVARSLIVR